MCGDTYTYSDLTENAETLQHIFDAC